MREIISTIISLQKALRDIKDAGIVDRPIPVGSLIESGDVPPDSVSLKNDIYHDYSHVLSDKHKQNGFKLFIRTPGYEDQQTELPWANTPSTSAILVKNNRVRGHVNVYHSKGIAQPHSNISPSLRGQGLGTAMYEAALAHSLRYQGAISVKGNPSKDADRVHKKLSQKHGFEYTPSGYNYKIY